ncbi:MAG: hypothetical protein IPH84_16030 [Bacteroidales bacterium]|nr:hypothetical protein [Bacteroidales bacterium]
MKNLAMIICLLFIAIAVNAQLAINSDGSLPDNSAMLDIKAPPRVSLLPG